jgi:hypothetical protein
MLTKLSLDARKSSIHHVGGEDSLGYSTLKIDQTFALSCLSSKEGVIVSSTNEESESQRYFRQIQKVENGIYP